MVDAQGDPQETDPSSLRVVNKYLDVFLEEFSGLLLERELEFCI